MRSVNERKLLCFQVSNFTANQNCIKAEFSKEGCVAHQTGREMMIEGSHRCDNHNAFMNTCVS